MKKTTIFFLATLAIAAVAIVAASFLLRGVEARRRQGIEAVATDGAPRPTEKVTLAGDPWIGYALLRSPEFRAFLENEGVALAYKDDGANYPDRMAKLASGEHDAIVTSLDAYLTNARRHEYPGVIVFVIDESKGGDGIVAVKDIKSLQDLAKPGVKIALTPNSPSDFLLRAVASHFDLAPLRINGPWRKETDGSAGALKALQAGNVQAAVLWEPDLTEATADPRFGRLFGTEKTDGLILDVCVFGKKFVYDRPQVAEKFAKGYFQTLRYYRQDRKALIDLIAKDASTAPAKAERMLAGIELASLARNLDSWFGVSAGGVAEVPGGAAPPREALLAAIRSNAEILVEAKLLPADAMAGDAPRKLMKSSFVETIRQQGLGKPSKVFKGMAETGPEGTDGSGSPAAGGIKFATLPDDGWKALKTIGALKTRPVVFQSGTSVVTLEGKQAVERMAEDLSHYPTYRLLVRGHTSTDGDPAENAALSQERAQTVATYLNRVLQVPESRMHAEGVGGSIPLPKDADESDRRWKGRLPRVELLLVEDPAVE